MEIELKTIAELADEALSPEGIKRARISEISYRRGCHQAVSIACDLIGEYRCKTADDAYEILAKFCNILGDMREEFLRGEDAGSYTLLDDAQKRLRISLKENEIEE